MKIILDDRRSFPDGPYNCVRTYEDCVEMIRLFRKISFISLDYDLGGGKTGYDVLAVTACPTGIAHTFMAAEALEKAAEKAGISLKVETNGSVGIKNALTEKQL